MLAKTESIETDAQEWLARFERALGAGGDALCARCFMTTATGAMCWRSPGTSGPCTAPTRSRARSRAHAGVAPSGFRLDPRRTAPRQVTRVGRRAIEAIFAFETAQGRGSGVLRLRAGR